MRTPVQIRKALACLFRAIDSYSWKKICLSFFFPLLLIQFIKAQDHPCYENPNCTSSDITIVGGSLASNIDGTPLIIDDCNTPPANAYLCITFLNGTGSPRNGIYMEGTITSGDKTCDIDYCFNDLLPPGTPTQVCAPAPVFEWNCMESVYLSDILTIWGPNSGQVCPGNTLDCNTTTKSKCFYSPDDSLMISIPLIPNFNFTKSCESNDMVETVTFNSTTVGGKEPYQSYLWEFGDGSTDSNNPTSHLYSGIGTFEVTLTVTDFVGHAEAIIKSVDVGPCCSFDITCPDDVTFDCDNIPVNKFDAAAGIINNYCGSISINDDFIHPGNCGGAVLTTFTIVDDQGTPLDDSDDIEITCVAEITINESPLSEVIDPVLPAVLNCEQAAEFIAPDAQYTNGLSGTCGISGNISPQYVYDYTNCGGFIEISYMDTDECFNNISAGPFTILVEPALEATFMNPPDDITLDCANELPTATLLFYTNGVSGLCANEGNITSTIIGNHNACGGTYTETWTGTDNCNNDLFYERTIYVDPAPAAQFVNLPQDINLTCSSAPPQSSELQYDNGVSGLCSNSGFISSIIDGSYTNCGGFFTETWTGIDDCGNPLNHQRLIIIDPAPAAQFVSFPENISISCIEAPPLSSTLDFNNEGLGLCANSGSINSTLQGSYDPCGGIYVETWQGIDNCGNPLSYQRTITIDPAPAAQFISTPGNISLSCAAAPPTSTDLFFANEGSGSCTNEGSISSTISGSHDQCGGQYTETWNGQDDCGNPLFFERIITIDPAPAAQFISTPGNISLSCAQAPPTSTDLFFANEGSGSCTNEGSISSTISGSHDQCGGQYTETWDGQDDCGNPLFFERIITIDPAPAAQFIEFPENMVIACSDVLPASSDLYYYNGGDGNCYNTGFISSTISSDFSNCYGTFIELWEGFDNCGNPLSYERTITMLPPSIAQFSYFPKDITIDCSLAPPAGIPLNYSNSENGACSIEGTLNSTLNGSFEPCNEVYIEIWEFTDDCGRTISTSRKITVEDVTAPLIMTAASDQVVECDGEGNIQELNNWLNNNAGAIASDDCNQITWTNNFTQFVDQCAQTGFAEVKFIATDLCGNSSSTSAVFTIIDITPPDIDFVNPLITGFINGDVLLIQCYGMDEEWDVPEFDIADVIASDICDTEVQIEFNDKVESDGDCPIDGYIRNYQLSWIATDACNNSSEMVIYIKVVDTIPPIIFGVPNDTIINCYDAIPNPYVYAKDECECADLSYEETSLAEGCVNGQQIIRKWLATDCCGNTSEQIQIISIVDEESPSIKFMDPYLVGMEDGHIEEYECLSEGYPDFLDLLDEGSVAAFDACDTAVSIAIKSYIEDAAYCEESNYVSRRVFTWTATDVCGNQSEISFYAHLVDHTPPVFIEYEEDICVDNIDDAAIVYAYDFCSNALTTHYDQEIDNECGEGIYVLRTFEAIDGCGNMSVATQEIHFSYNQGPSLEIINPLLAGLVSGDTISMPCGFNYPNSITGFGPDDVVFAEDCASNIEIHFTETIITENDCEGGFAQTLVLLTWQGENACAANSQIEIFVNLYDEEVPTILNFEEKMMLSCGDEIPEVIVTDNCSKVEVFIEEYEYIVGRCPDVLVIKRYIYLVDACGNQVAYDQELIFMDEIGPEIFGIEEEVCNDTSMPDAYAYDACMDAFVELIMSEDTMTGCDDGMLLKRTWSAEDNCRNVTIIEQYIVIDDTIAPTINIFDPWVNYFLNNPIVFTSNVDAMQGLESINLASVLGEDNCDPIIVPVYEALTTMAEDCEADGFYSNHLFSWSFSDNCENTSNLDMNVIVIDNEAPIIENMPEDTTIYCQEMIPPPKLIITDHSEYTIEMYEMSMDSISYYRIWTVTDACGNSTTYEQVIRLDNESDLTCAIESVEEIVYCNTHYNEFAGIATGGTAPYTYEWEALSGVCFLQGSIYEDTVQVYVGFTEIILQLTVTDANGCITICTYTITCTDKADGFTTGIDPGFTEGEIFDNMYCIPNPVYNEMILTFNTSFTGPLSIDIYDALGQHKMTLDKNAVMGINQIPLQMESLNEGQYIMRVFAEGSIGLIRFTKIELF